MSGKSPQITAKLNLDNSSMRSSLGQSKREVGSFSNYARQSLGTIGKGLALGAGGIVAALGFGVKRNMDIESTTIALKSFMGGAEKAREAVEMLRKEATDRPIFSLNEIMGVGRSLSSLAGGNVNKLKSLVQLTEKLSLLNPGEGIEGAAFSLKEMSSWDYTSIVERFNVSKKRLLELKALGVEGTQAVAKILTEMGISDVTLDDFGNSFSGMIATVKSTIETFATETSKGLFDNLKPRMEELKGYLAEHQQTIKAAAVGISDAIASIVDLSVKATEVTSVTAAGIGAEAQSWKDSMDRGEIDWGGAAQGVATSMYHGLGWAAEKVNAGAWGLIGNILKPGEGYKWTRDLQQEALGSAAARWAKMEAADESVNQALKTDKHKTAADDAREAAYLKLHPSTAQLGPGVTNRPQNAKLNVNVASAGYTPPMTAGAP